MSVLPSVRNNAIPTGRILVKSYVWAVYQNSTEKIQFTWRCDKNKGEIYMNTDVHLWLYLAEFFLECEMFLTNIVKESKRHILCSISTGLFEILSGISDLCGIIAGMVTLKGSMSTEGETYLPYRCSICSLLLSLSWLLRSRFRKFRKDFMNYPVLFPKFEPFIR